MAEDRLRLPIRGCARRGNAYRGGSRGGGEEEEVVEREEEGEEDGDLHVAQDTANYEETEGGEKGKKMAPTTKWGYEVEISENIPMSHTSRPKRKCGGGSSKNQRRKHRPRWPIQITSFRKKKTAEIYNPITQKRKRRYHP